MPIRVFLTSVGTPPPPPPPPPTPPPTPPPPPPPPPNGVTCVVADTQILMLDGSQKRIDKIAAGDLVKTLNGHVGRVERVDRPLLGRARRIINMYHPDGRMLRISDDHDLWIRRGTGVEEWGTYNANWWRLEAEYEGTQDVTAEILKPYRAYEFAVDTGWTETFCEWELHQDPETRLYGLKLDHGGGYIANGFVIIANECTPDECKDVIWTGP